MTPSRPLIVRLLGGIGAVIVFLIALIASLGAALGAPLGMQLVRRWARRRDRHSSRTFPKPHAPIRRANG